MPKKKISSPIIGHVIILILAFTTAARSTIQSGSGHHKVDHHRLHNDDDHQWTMNMMDRSPADLVQPKPTTTLDAKENEMSWTRPCDKKCRKDCQSPPPGRPKEDTVVINKPPWKISRQNYYHQPIQNPLQKALRFLERDCSPTVGYQTVISNSTKFRYLMLPATETYSSAIVLGLVHRIPGLDPIIPKILLHFLHKNKQRSGLSNFFVDRTIIPNDVEDSSIILNVLLETGHVKSSVARQAAQIILKNTNDKGVITEYIEPFSNHPQIKGLVGPGALSNVLRLLSTLRMEGEAAKTMDFLYNWLNSKASNGQSLYYGPDAVIYFLSNSVPVSKTMRKKFSQILTKKLMARFGQTKNPLDISMRILAASNLKLFTTSSSNKKKNHRHHLGGFKFASKIAKHKITCEYNRLLTLQRWDGSWAKVSVTTSDDGFIYYGSEAITTAYAAKALHLLTNASGRPT